MHTISRFYSPLRSLAAFAYAVAPALLLVGCLETTSPSSDEAVTGMTFADFRKILAVEAKPDANINDADSAADCGHLAAEADTSGSNCCVAENYANFLPFFVSMDENSRSHESVRAFTRNARGVVYQYHYKQDLDERGRVNNGGYQRAVCTQAELVENACSATANQPFTCSNPL